MLNEAVFRSPKWMRNFLDFEINTGGDIKGEPSKKAILKEWDKRWSDVIISNRDYLIDFYFTEIKNDIAGRYLTARQLEDIRIENRGDMSFWNKFDKWLPEYKDKKKRQQEKFEKFKREERERQERWKKEKEREQERIKKELDSLFNAIVSDFSNNPYIDKCSTPKKSGRVCFHYRFENGDTFEMDENEIKYKGKIYTVGSFYRNKFVRLCNEMTSKGRTRPGGSKSWSGGSSSSGSRYSSKTKSDDPNRDRFDKIKDNIKLREEQLGKMSKTDPERFALENELDNLKRALKRMKDRYQFEHITNYFDFKV